LKTDSQQETNRREAMLSSKSLTTLGLAIIPLFLAASAGAQGLNALLDGNYEFSARRSCVTTQAGFGALGQLLGPAETHTTSATGTSTYNGDGTGTLAGSALVIFDQRTAAGAIPVVEVDFRCRVTYTVRPDRSFSQDLTCRSRVASGPGAGTITDTTGIHHEGQIARGHNLVKVTDTDSNIETLTSPTGPTRENICNRVGTAIRTP
jgi:hypothetical protein